jgi:RNA polymerase sigma factor (sigma-70 family)
VQEPITGAQFEELYRDTARDLFSYVRRRGARDAEGIVAETFVVAWRRRAEMPDPAVRRAWLFGVAGVLLRAEGRVTRRERTVTRELASTPFADDHHGTSNDAAARIMSAALERLPPAQRELLRLAAWEGLSPVELAAALGVRPGTARVRLHRARRALASDPELRSLLGVTAVAPQPQAALHLEPPSEA